MTVEGGYRKYNEISFLRGFSITTVILMHLVQVFVANADIPLWLRTASSLGGTGGHVFVFCSGFGLYLSYLKKPLQIGAFLKKRFLKIYVPYIMFVFIEFCLPHAASRGQLLRQLLSHIFLYKMFFDKYTISFGLQFWFISTIFQFYLLFIPLCRFRERFSCRALMLLGVGLSVLWWTLMEITGLGESRVWGSFCLQYLWEFTLGMAAAEYAYHHQEIRIPLKGIWLCAVVGLPMQAMLAKLGGWFAAFNDVPALFGYGCSVLLLWNYGKRLLRPVFLWVDGISYEWFLVHTSVFARFYGNMRRYMTNEVLLAVSAFALSLAVAVLYAKLVRLILKKLRV